MYATYLNIILYWSIAFADKRTGRYAGSHRESIYCSSAHSSCDTHPSLASVGGNIDVTCAKDSCGVHAFCFLGSCLCHPGYAGAKCETRLLQVSANPWFTSPCPNLQQDVTYAIDTPLSELGGEYKDQNACDTVTKTGFCSYLCYGHREYGVAVVPSALWSAAQRAESSLWQQIGTQHNSITNDRAEEHWSAFDHFKCLKGVSQLGQLRSMGRVMEVGAGPWTQVKGLLYTRPDLTFDELTIW
jgi:hypothetical protein